MRERTCVIVNPAAGRGRGARMIPEVASAFAAYGVTDIRETRVRGDEAAITTAAISDGCTTIVAVGGDGTVSNVANTILHSGSDARVAVLPAGTGNDFAKLLGTAHAGPTTMARLCAEAPEQRVDAARIEDVYFINCCGFGFDVAVLEGIARNTRLRGNAVYVYTALTQILGYRGSEIAIRSAASDRPRSLHMMLVIANASFFGGTFEIAPGASAVDGKLDAVSLLEIPAWKRIAVLGAAILGKHEKFAECIRERASSFDLIFSAPPSYETDGEVHHAASATLTVSSCPAALRVVAAQPLR